MSGTVETTVLQTQTVVDSTGGSVRLSTFAQFDPSLGTLVDVRIGIAGTVSSTASIENQGAAGASVQVALPTTIELFTPPGSMPPTPNRIRRRR